MSTTLPSYCSSRMVIWGRCWWPCSTTYFDLKFLLDSTTYILLFFGVLHHYRGDLSLCALNCRICDWNDWGSAEALQVYTQACLVWFMFCSYWRLSSNIPPDHLRLPSFKVRCLLKKIEIWFSCHFANKAGSLRICLIYIGTLCWQLTYRTDIEWAHLVRKACCHCWHGHSCQN